jgi:hypothetical protein
MRANKAASRIVSLAERERMLVSRIALRATAEGGDRFAIVLDTSILSRIIAFRQT